jgi:hypothetical protein
MYDSAWINKRRPLWVALSELWLDTELSIGYLEAIARVMADSGLSVEELRQVYLTEVAPVVAPNLLTVAGAWSGFDEEWLCSQIIRNLRDRPRLTRFWSWFPLTRKAMLYATEEHWETLVELMKVLRSRV